MKELQENLLKKIGIRLDSFGFKTKLADQSFVRVFHGGRQSCHVSFIKHSDDFDVTADVAVRFDALEDMVNADSIFLSKKLKANTYSIGCELGNLVYGEQHRWSVLSADDVTKTAEAIGDFFVLYGLPYLEKYSDMETVFDLIAPHPERVCLHAPFEDYRAKRAVGLALLIGKTKELPTLIAGHEAHLKTHYLPGLQGFQDFLKKYV